jgi:hypothetical protein
MGWAGANALNVLRGVNQVPFTGDSGIQGCPELGLRGQKRPSGFQMQIQDTGECPNG